MTHLFSFPASMAWPLVAALALTGILVYFGIHVIGRKVIFVDLAMAQIAALGAAFGVLMGYELEHSPTGLFLYSLAFTLFAALVFSITKMKTEDIPHEAIIGITYAVAVAATMIVLSRSALGPQEFDRMMKGELLYVTRDKVLFPIAVYAAVGAFHAICRKQFFTLSFGNPADLKLHRIWDFLFYASFGFVVTSSVAIAGIFLVFCILVIPAVGSFLFSKRIGVRLATGWIGGAFLCTLGLKLSYDRNWPPSPTVVCCFAAALIAAGAVRYVRTSASRSAALFRMAALAGVVAAFGGGLWVFRHREPDPFQEVLHLVHSEDEAKRLTALKAFDDAPERRTEWRPHALRLLGDRDGSVRVAAMELLVKHHEVSALDEIVTLLRDPEDHVRERCTDLLHELGQAGAAPPLIAAGDAEASIELRVRMYGAALELGDRAAVDRLIAVLEDPNVKPRRKDKAYEALAAHVDFAFTADRVEALKTWWNLRRDRTVWRSKDGRMKFVPVE